MFVLSHLYVSPKLFTPVFPPLFPFIYLLSHLSSELSTFLSAIFSFIASSFFATSLSFFFPFLLFLLFASHLFFSARSHVFPSFFFHLSSSHSVFYSFMTDNTTALVRYLNDWIKSLDLLGCFSFLSLEHTHRTQLLKRTYTHAQVGSDPCGRLILHSFREASV